MRLRSFAACLALLLPACDSRVTDPRSDVSSVQIKPDTTLTLLTGTEFPLQAEASRADGSIASDARITWRSSPPERATVDNTGLLRTAPTFVSCYDFPHNVTCVAMITATAGARSDTLYVRLRPRIVIHGTVSVVVQVGDSTQLIAPYGTIDEQILCPYERTSLMDTSVAILRNGYVIGVSPGRTVIFWAASSTGVSRLCTLPLLETAIDVTPR